MKYFRIGKLDFCDKAPVDTIVTFMKQNPESDIVIVLDSHGGKIAYSEKLRNALASHKGKKCAYVKLAESAAAMILGSFDEVKYSNNAKVMVHTLQMMYTDGTATPVSYLKADRNIRNMIKDAWKLYRQGVSSLGILDFFKYLSGKDLKFTYSAVDNKLLKIK